ncbi:hypothetical protein C9439_03570 [archaeon SCG-AAA382B04]|nr:hypothetical protein C9439_03570 [archaeon SCG-AAA382B04]
MVNKKLLSLLLLTTILLAPITKAKNTHTQIDKNTVLIGYTHQESRFKLKIRSEIKQEIAIYDVIKLFNGKQRVKKIIEIEKGINNVTFNASLMEGKSAIRIVTKKDSIPLTSRDKAFYQEPANWIDVETAAITGTATGFLLPLSYALYEKKRETNEPEEII